MVQSKKGRVQRGIMCLLHPGIFTKWGGGRVEGPGPPDSKKLGQRCFVIFAVFLVLMHLQLI